MSIHNLFRRLMTKSARPARTIRRHASPLGRVMEGLEARVVPTVFNVTAAMGPTAIQDALDASADGDTINVAAGDYYETLEVTTGVTLHGAGIGQTRVHSDVSDPYASSGDASSYMVSLRSSNVNINNITFDGTAHNGAAAASSPLNFGGTAIGASEGIINNFFPGAAVPVSNITIQNVEVTNVAGDGIVLQKAGGNNTVSNNTISNYGFDTTFSEGFAGIGLFDNTIATVQSNTITAPSGANAPLKQFGIQIDGVGSALPSGTKSVSSNTITVGKDSIGISINNVFGGGGLTVSGNHVLTTSFATFGSNFDPSRGINVSTLVGSTVALTGNFVNASDAGPPAVNYVAGTFARGISVYNVGTGVTISGGAVANSQFGLYVEGSDSLYGGGAFGSTVTVSAATIGGATAVLLHNDPVANTAFIQGSTPTNTKAMIAAPKGNLRVDFLDGSITGATAGTNASAVTFQDQTTDGYTTKVSFGGTTAAGTAVTGLILNNAKGGSTETAAVDDVRKARKFDFGTTDSAVAAGYIGLYGGGAFSNTPPAAGATLNTSIYSVLGSYGFTTELGTFKTTNTSPTVLQRAGVSGNTNTGTFLVNLLANKTYAITVYTGNPISPSKTQVTATAGGATVSPVGSTFAVNNSNTYGTVKYTVTTTSATTLSLAFSLYSGVGGGSSWAVGGVDVTY